MKKNTNKDPFKTPQNYFDSFDEKLMDKLHNEVSMIPKSDGFSVPDNYFNTLQDKLNDKLKDKGKVVPLRSYKRYYAVAAAVAALFIFVIGQQFNSTEELSFMDLANSEIEAYFDSNDLDMSTYELVEVLPVGQLEINDILDTHINDDNIEDYLQENIQHLEELNLD